MYMNLIIKVFKLQALEIACTDFDIFIRAKGFFRKIDKDS